MDINLAFGYYDAQRPQRVEMSPLVIILIASWLAGLASFLGGALAQLERSPRSEAKQEFIHFMTAMGGGVLLAAVAFALMPTGIELLNPWLL